MKQLIFILSILMSQTINSQVFVYEFQDSSVPPPYHRSYSIKVTATTVELTIDSYGEVLLNDTTTIDQSTFDDFVSALKGCNLQGKKRNEDDGCTGGTGDSFSADFGEGNTFTGYVYHCGGEDYGNIKGDIARAKDLFKNLVPDFSGKMSSTMED